MASGAEATATVDGGAQPIPGSSPFTLRGDALALVLSFCETRPLLCTLPRVSKSFRACIASSALAWAPGLSLDERLRKAVMARLRHCHAVGDRSGLEHAWSCVASVRLPLSGAPAANAATVPVLAELCPRLRDIEIGRVSCATLARIAGEFHGLQRLRVRIADGDDEELCRSLRALAAGCSQLRCLELSTRCAIDEATAAALAASCPELNTLRLSGGGSLPAESCRALALSPRLRTLELYDVGEGGGHGGLRALLAGCVLLESLALGSTAWPDDAAAVAVGATCPRLRELRVCSATGVTGLSALARGCPLLERLCLEACLPDSDATLAALAVACPRLHTVDVAGALSDAAFVALVSACPLLRALRISGCEGVTNTTLVAVGAHATKLNHLCVQGCRGVTDEGMCAVARGCPQLRTISLARTGATDVSIWAMATMCRELRSVDASDCLVESDETMRAMALGCAHLSSFFVSAGAGVTVAALVSVVERCRHLKALAVSWRQRTAADFAPLRAAAAARGVTVTLTRTLSV